MAKEMGAADVLLADKDVVAQILQRTGEWEQMWRSRRWDGTRTVSGDC